jgi:regulator of protease activity HflC (stomatin/prohibitin superfamily)
MWKRIDIALGERAVLHEDGKPVRWLGPGRYRVFTWPAKLEVIKLYTDRLTAQLRSEQAALAPADELRVVELGAAERAILWQDGVPQRWLKAGRHYVWTVDPSVRVEVIDTSGVATAPLMAQTRAVVDGADYRETTVPQGCVAVRYVDGVLDEVLGPGRHAAWTCTKTVEYAVLDMRERVMPVSAQEVMTKDRVSVRLNAAVVYRIADARQVAEAARDVDEQLYLASQMALREAVTARTLDELIAAREALTEEVTAPVKRRGAELGLAVERVGLKDVILPGDMKTLLNRVIEAKKQAEANVILRREEAAATRALAQTAQLLADQPVLLRLKELEAYKELAESVGQVHVVLGEGATPQLQLKS